MWTQLYPLWCAVQRGKTLATLGLAVLTVGDAAPAAPGICDEGVKEAEADGLSAQDHLQKLAVVSEANRTLGQAINAKRQEQSNNRWKALQWSMEKYQYCLFVIFCVARLVLEPMRVCMDSYIVASGNEHDVDWMRDEAKACKQKRHTGTGNLGRLLAGFHGDHTRDGRDRLLHLMQSGLQGKGYYYEHNCLRAGGRVGSLCSRWHTMMNYDHYVVDVVHGITCMWVGGWVNKLHDRCMVDYDEYTPRSVLHNIHTYGLEHVYLR